MGSSHLPTTHAGRACLRPMSLLCHGYGSDPLYSCVPSHRVVFVEWVGRSPQPKTCFSMDWVHTFLVTTDSSVVDEPLFTAIQSLDLSWIDKGHGIEKFILETIHKVKGSRNITMKKFSWIALMLVSPGMQSFVSNSCSRGASHAERWIRDSHAEVRAFLTGETVSMGDVVARITDLYIG